MSILKFKFCVNSKDLSIIHHSIVLLKALYVRNLILNKIVNEGWNWLSALAAKLQGLSSLFGSEDLLQCIQRTNTTLYKSVNHALRHDLSSAHGSLYKLKHVSTY